MWVVTENFQRGKMKFVIWNVWMWFSNSRVRLWTNNCPPKRKNEICPLECVDVICDIHKSNVTSFFIYFFMVLRNKSNVIQLAKKNLNNITKIIFPHFFIRVLYIGLIQLFQAVLYQTCFWVELWFQNAITENLKKLKGVFDIIV